MHSESLTRTVSPTEPLDALDALRDGLHRGRTAVWSRQYHHTMHSTPTTMTLKPTTSLTTFRRRLGESTSFLAVRASKPTSANGACGPIIELGKLPGPTTITNPIPINRTPKPTTTQFIRPLFLRRQSEGTGCNQSTRRRANIPVSDPRPSRACRQGASRMPTDAAPDGWYSVLGRNSHAWPEIWFDGVGWVAFDRPPAATSRAPRTTPVRERRRRSRSPAPRRPPRSATGAGGVQTADARPYLS